VVRVFSGDRGRWLAVAASVAVSVVAMLQGQDKEACCAETPAVGAANQAAPVVSTPIIAAAKQAELLVANAPVAAPDFQFPLSPGVTPEDGLQVNTIWVARAISMMFFREISTIGGLRQDPLPWHPNGLAVDVMIPNHNSPEGIELGNQIAGFVLANAKRWGVLHVIWRQGFYPGVGAPSWMANYGNETANHFDHVHIATVGGGFPTGRETYYLGSMTTTP
jgi:hypothetical protein